MNEQDHVQRIIIGRATFQRIPRRFIEFIQNSEQIRSTLENQKWNIKQGDYLINNWKKIFKYMSECQASKINFWGNYRVQIISQIQNVQFVNLRKLNLSRNKIANIQSLSSINFQCLQLLNLSQNNISQIKSLNKLSTPFLLYILFFDNPLYEINALIKSKINQKKLNQLIFQWFNIYQPLPINYDLSVISKLNCEQIKKFFINEQCRIRQEKVQSMLKLRFPGIKVCDEPF